MQTIEKELAVHFPMLVRHSDPAVERMLSGAHSTSLDEGQQVFRAGDSCDNFLLLLRGSIRVQLTAASGREVVLYRISAGGSCVLTTSCLLGGEQYPAEAIAESDVTAVAVPGRWFHEALNRSDEFRRFVFDGFANRLSGVIQRIEEIAFTSIDQRLAAALLRVSHEATGRATHQQLAVEIGTAREVVSRHLKRFESHGWIVLGRGRVLVNDVAQLEAIASDGQCD